MEVYQTGCVGEKLPLEGTFRFQPLQTIYMHKNLYTSREHRKEKKGPAMDNRVLDDLPLQCTGFSYFVAITLFLVCQILTTQFIDPDEALHEAGVR